MSIQNGKKPLSQKQTKATPFNLDDIFGNPLGLDPAIVKAIQAKGWAHRFINMAKLQSMGGYHQRGWRPVKMTEIGCDKMDTHQFALGSDPEGYIRRGDCVLAVRPIELHEKHKAYLAQEAKARSQSQKKHAQDLRSFARSAGLDTQVVEGFEDET